jgi:hypothetical protein
MNIGAQPRQQAAKLAPHRISRMLAALSLDVCESLTGKTNWDARLRAQYLERFKRVNRPAWTMLTDEEWAQVDHHVTTCDFPETAAGWLELGRRAGFSEARQFFEDPTAFYRVFRCDG